MLGKRLVTAPSHNASHNNLVLPAKSDRLGQSGPASEAHIPIEIHDRVIRSPCSGELLTRMLGPITDSNPKCGPKWQKRCSSHGGLLRPCTGSWARATWRAARAWSPSRWQTHSRTVTGRRHPAATSTRTLRGASPEATRISSAGTRAAQHRTFRTTSSIRSRRHTRLLYPRPFRPYRRRDWGVVPYHRGERACRRALRPHPSSSTRRAHPPQDPGFRRSSQGETGAEAAGCSYRA